jgi:hypothetical protein
MAEIDEVQILADPDTEQLLTATLERVNRASNAARVSALQRNAFAGKELREVVKEIVEQQKLPEPFITPITDRVAASLTRRAGKQPKFSNFQSLTLPAGAFKWSSDGKVAMPTAKGKRTIRVRVDTARGGLRPPLEGRPAMLVFRNKEFFLSAADVERATIATDDDDFDPDAWRR